MSNKVKNANEFLDSGHTIGDSDRFTELNFPSCRRF